MRQSLPGCLALLVALSTIGAVAQDAAGDYFRVSRMARLALATAWLMADR
ncbi:MAG: hypothetical protein IPP78_02320 [Holophagaceae bacterium]|nr:hypothetical protein [Holophagaceae bacterium]